MFLYNQKTDCIFEEKVNGKQVTTYFRYRFIKEESTKFESCSANNKEKLDIKWRELYGD